MINTESTVIEFSPTQTGTIPKGFLDMFPKAKTVYLGDMMLDELLAEAVPDREMVLFLPKGYPHKIGEDFPEKVAVAMHTCDIDFYCQKLPSRSVFFSWKGDSEGYYEGCFSFSDNIMKKGFKDPEYDQGNRWIIAVHRNEEGKFLSKGTVEINKISDYWKKEEPVQEIEEEIEIEEELTTQTDDIEVIVSEGMIPIMREKAEEKRLENIKEEIRQLAVKIGADITDLFKDHPEAAFYRSYEIKKGWMPFIDRLKKHLPGLNVTFAHGYVRIKTF